MTKNFLVENLYPSVKYVNIVMVMVKMGIPLMQMEKVGGLAPVNTVKGLVQYSMRRVHE